MRLFKTDSEFVWKGLSRPGVPFLCDCSMELVRAPNLFLRYIACVKGRTRAPATWNTYAEHLYEYFAFLECNDWDWAVVGEEEVAAWRDSMTERGCDRNTANQRLDGVRRFYRWAAAQGMPYALKMTTEPVRVPPTERMLVHLDTSGGVVEADTLSLSNSRPVPEFLRLNDALTFLDALSPVKTRLMGYLALTTGMRREETSALDYRVVPNPAGHNSRKQLRMTLDASITPTKGSQTRVVMVPYDLGVAMRRYFEQEWPKLAKLFKQQTGRETTKFFLSHGGDELSEKYLNNAFAKASAKCGIVCHPHMLRHTFGTYELLRMTKKYGESKALFWVKERMGHSHVSVTERYIHAADLVSHDEVDDYMAEICGALRGGTQS